MSKSKAVEAKALDKQIDAVELADMSPEEMDAEAVRIVSGNSPEAVELRRLRRGVRYKLYRLRTEIEGKCSAPDIGQEFRSRFEKQPLFKGWRFFGSLWDVALADPYLVVARDHTEQEEWDQIIRSKYPQLTPGGGVHYPDITVKRKVEAAEKRLVKE